MAGSGRTSSPYQGPQPASNPFAKVVSSSVINAFGGNIWGDRRASYVGTAGTTDQAIIQPNGTCGSGVATPTSFILPFDTQAPTDSFNLSINGGPKEPDAGNVFTQNIGPSATTIISGWKVTKGSGARKLPYYSAGKIYAGKGIQGGKGTTGVGSPPAYGTFDIPDPKNPGSYLTNPGTADPVVSGAEIEVELAYDKDPASNPDAKNVSYLKFGGWDGNGVMADIDALKTAGLGGGGSGGALAQFNCIGDNGVSDGFYIAIQSFTSTPAAVEWAGTTFKSGGFTWDSAHPTRIDIGADGDYVLLGQLYANATASQIVEVDLYQNGVLQAVDTAHDLPEPTGLFSGSGAYTTIPINFAVSCKNGDYLEVFVSTGTDTVSVKGDYTWVTIWNASAGSGGSVPTIQFWNNTAATPDLGVSDVMHWDDPTVDPQLDTSGGAIAKLDPGDDTLIDILEDGTYEVAGQIQGFLNGDGSSGNWQFEIDLYLNGVLYGSSSAVPKGVCLPATPTYLAGAQQVTFPFRYLIEAKNGDTLSLPIAGPMPSGWSGSVGSSYTWLAISKVG